MVSPHIGAYGPPLFTPGNFRPSMILGTASKELQRQLKEEGKAINRIDGRISGMSMRKAS